MDYQELYIDLLIQHRKLLTDIARLNKYFEEMIKQDERLAIVEPAENANHSNATTIETLFTR